MHILIIQPSALGDIIYTLYNIKRLYYSAPGKIMIDWYTPNYYEILESQPEINVVKNITKLDYDYVIDFGTKRNTLWCKWQQGGIKIGFVATKKKWISWFNDYSIHYDNEIGVVQNQIQLLEFLCNLMKINLKKEIIPELHYEQFTKTLVNKYIDTLPLQDAPFVILNPNTSKEKKEQPLSSWCNLLEIFSKDETRNYILIGAEFGKKGKLLERYIQTKNYTNIHVLPKRLDRLVNIGFLLLKAETVMTPDTSILHLAEYQKVNVIPMLTEYSSHINIGWNQ